MLLFITMPRKPLPVPTQARPGSEEKIAILEERYAAGKQLHHDADFKIGSAARSSHRATRVTAERAQRVRRVAKACDEGLTQKAIAEQEGISRGQVARDLDLVGQPLDQPEPKGTGLARVKRFYKARLWHPRLKHQILVGYYRSIEEGMEALLRAKTLLGLMTES